MTGIIRSIEAATLFSSDGRMRAVDMPGWCLYLAFCKPWRGHSFVKVGVSSVVYERALAFQAGCPFPFDVIRFAGIGQKSVAYTVEAAVHRELKQFATAREWFAFETENAAEAPELRDAIRAALKPHFEQPLTWRAIDASALSKFSTERQRKRSNRHPLY